MRIIWQTLRRIIITDEILGFKGLRELAMKGSMSCGGDVMGRENGEENHALFIYFPYSTLPLDSTILYEIFHDSQGQDSYFEIVSSIWQKSLSSWY